MSEPAKFVPPVCEVCKGPAIDHVHELIETEKGWQHAGERHYCREHCKPPLMTHRDGKKTRNGVEVKE